jgi:hypothetical protein
MTTTCTICAALTVSTCSICDDLFDVGHYDYDADLLLRAVEAAEAASSELPADAAAMLKLHPPRPVIEWLVAYYLPDTEIGRHLRHRELMHYFSGDDCYCHYCRHKDDSLLSDIEPLMRGTNPAG